MPITAIITPRANCRRCFRRSNETILAYGEREKLPENAQTYDVRIKLYNGRKYYAFVESLRLKSSCQFHRLSPFVTSLVITYSYAKLTVVFNAVRIRNCNNNNNNTIRIFIGQ